MGVPKLWEELEPAVSITSWSQLSEPAFLRDGVRGLRTGVDVSGWLFHMGRMLTITDADGQVVNPGANADLRMVFFRVLDLLKRGVLPLFVFDGPHRPSWKRGQRVGGQVFGGRSPQELKRMFNLLGVQWRDAPGEAEAELAELQKRGEIDVVLSDDVDAFLFGAEKVVRNPSKGLSSNKSKIAVARKTYDLDASQPSSSQPAGSQTPFPSQYQSSSQLAHLPVTPSYEHALPTFAASRILSTTGLSSDSLILIALLAGGDYLPTGFKNVGVTIAVALAKAGYAATLLDGVRRIGWTGAGMPAFLERWRTSVAHELRTNSNKLFKTRHLKLADELDAASEFPSLAVVRNYLEPVVSSPGEGEPLRWDRRIDLKGLVAFCQGKFEWGNDEMESRARNLLWLPLAVEELRAHALASSPFSRAASPFPSSSSSSSSPRATALPRGWITRISDIKSASSTDFSPSYRIELAPAIFGPLVHAALPSVDPHPLPDYSRLDEKEEAEERLYRKERGRLQEPMKDPGTSSYRHWLPVGFASVEGSEAYKAAEAFEEEKERKKREKQDAEERKAARAAGRSPTKSPRKASSAAVKKKGKRRDDDSGDSDAWMEAEMRRVREKVARAREAVVGKGKGKAPAAGHARRKSLLDEDEDDVLLPPGSGEKSKGKGKALTLVLSSSPPPSSEHDLPNPSTSRARPPKSARPTALTSAFSSSKPTISSAFSSSKPSLSRDATVGAKPKRAIRAPSFDEDDDDDLFGPTPSLPSKPAPTPRAKPAPKRAIRAPSTFSSSAPSRAVSPLAPPVSPPLSSASSDDGRARRTVAHVAKAPRGAAGQRSPQKKRPVRAPVQAGGVIDLCDSSDEDERDLPAARRSPATGQGSKEGESGGGETLQAFWARRRTEQERKKSGREEGVIELSSDSE
ncbi:hypothetical protein JCM10213_001466 [Rhodosporidiobolus nylandii]